MLSRRCVGSFLLLLVGRVATAVPCNDISGSSLETARSKVLAIRALNQLVENLHVSGDWGQPESEVHGVYPQPFYLDGRLIVQPTPDLPSLTKLGVASFELPQEMVIGQQISHQSNQNVRVLKTWVDGDPVYISRVARPVQLRTRRNQEGFLLAFIDDAVEVATLGRNIFVLAGTQAAPYFYSVEMPDQLPHSSPAQMRFIKLNSFYHGLMPRMLPYGDVLIIGGLQGLTILEPQSGLLIALRMPDDRGRNPIVHLEDLGDGNVRITRKLGGVASTYREYVLDFHHILAVLRQPL